MKESKQGKQTIYLDVDDVVFNSSEVVLDILNKKYDLHKTMNDIKDWCYTSIYKKMTPKVVEEIYESEEFWSKVKIRGDFLENIVYNKEIQKNYIFAFVTQGNEKNLKKKIIHFIEHSDFKDIFKESNFYGVGLDETKDDVDMSNGVQIDDNFKNLRNTNSKLKILLKNNIDTKYNNYDYKDEITNREDLYIIDNFEELRDILLFNLEEKIF